MKLVFFGSPDFAIPSLNRLYAHHQVVAVVTGPDKPAGRGQVLCSTAVKKEALTKRIPVLQPGEFEDSSFLQHLQTLNADVFVVVAFKILPAAVFEIPPVGTINLHASLLPKYRGAAPIQWALINGEKTSGVTTFFINERVDTGDILLQKEYAISENMIAAELHDALADLGADALVETLDGLQRNRIKPKHQTGRPTRAPKIHKHLGEIDWSQSAETIHNLIRGLSPYPGAFSFLQKRYVKFIRSQLTDIPKGAQKEGALVEQDFPKRLLVQTGDGVLEILQLQPFGRKQMRATEFLCGCRLQKNPRFVQKNAR